ncbi:LuxR C-terminal-related transcriptional regulator [Actinacidiphila sp. bgisy144]|uniref:helix-turn-helix transcriptional regulator n=1 Tax=Actinacidiphila sp. bgisy144 TaxID=3413791 RepID=UPI003EBCA5B2
MPVDTGHDWPMAARDRELTAVTAAVDHGGGVLLDGDPGMGKTRLLEAALERAAAAGRSVVAVGGAWRGGQEDGAPVETFATLADCLDRLGPLPRQAAAPRRPLVGLDDAHLVDEASAAHLYRLAAAGQLAVAAAVRRGAPAPAPIDQLWVARLVERIELAPFDRRAVARALHERLAGHLEAATLERLWADTGGNPLILRELVEHSLADGSLRQVDGMWRWRGLAEPPTRRLAAVVHLGLRDLAPDEQELVNMLALAEPLEADIAAHFDLSRAAESLNLRGVVAVERAGHRLRLRLALPLSRVVVAARMSDLTARRLRRQIAAWIESTGARRADDQLRLITLRLDAGLVPEPQQLLGSAHTAFRQQDFALAERLCRLALDSAGGRTPYEPAPYEPAPYGPAGREGPGYETGGGGGAFEGRDGDDGFDGPGAAARGGGPDRTGREADGQERGEPEWDGRAARASAVLPAFARRVSTRVAPTGTCPPDAPADVPATLLLGRIMAGQGRHAEAERVFAAALDGDCPAPDCDFLAAVRARAANLAEGLRRLADAADVLDRTTAAVGAERALPLQGYRAVIAILAGRLRHAVEIGDQVLPAEPAASRVTQELLPAVAFARIELGDPAAASEQLAACRGQVDAWADDARLRYFVLLAHCCFLSGDLGGYGAALEAVRRHSGGDEQQRRLHVALLRARLHRDFGRTGEAVVLLREASAVHGHGDGDWLATPAWTLARLAGALAQSGQHSDALRTLVEARLVQSEAAAHPVAADDIALERALVLACTGDRSGAAGQALAVAKRAVAGQRPAAAVAALHLAARLSDSVSVAGQAERLAACTTSELARLQADHIRALAAGDGDALTAVSVRFRVRGALPLAAEAAAQAARAYRAAGRRRKSREARAAAHGILADHGGSLPPWMATEQPPVHAAAALTAREREVAALAATGLSNRDIAGRLVVSVRTVENHLHRVYHKLGVTARAELARVLGHSPAPVPIHDPRPATPAPHPHPATEPHCPECARLGDWAAS